MFIAYLFFFLLLFGLLFERLRSVLSPWLSGLDVSRSARQLGRSPAWVRVSIFLAPLVSRFVKSDPELRQRLLMVGLPPTYREDGFAVTRVMSTLIVFFVGALLGSPLGWSFWNVLSFSALAFFFPILVLRVAIQRSINALERDLPVFLDGVAISLAGGYGLTSALSLSTEQFSARDSSLSLSMTRLVSDLRSGYDKESAFKRLRDQTISEGLRRFAVACLTSEAGGSDLSRVIEQQAKSLRRLRLSQMERRAMEAPVKMLAPLVLCIFPSTFVIVLAPLLRGLSSVFS